MRLVESEQSDLDKGIATRKRTLSELFSFEQHLNHQPCMWKKSLTAMTNANLYKDEHCFLILPDQRKQTKVFEIMQSLAD